MAAPALGGDQAGGAELLEVARAVGELEAGRLRERLHGARPLAEEVHELEADRARQRLAEACDLAVVGQAGPASGVVDHDQLSD